MTLSAAQQKMKELLISKEKSLSTPKSNWSLLRRMMYFPTFAELPAEHDADVKYFRETSGALFVAFHHWCFLGEITKKISFVRPGCIVQDISGTEVDIHFYLDMNKALVVGSILCLKYPFRKQFADGSVGIRVQNGQLPFLQIIPNLTMAQLLRISDTGCLMDYYRANVLKQEMTEENIINNQCWFKRCKHKNKTKKNIHKRKKKKNKTRKHTNSNMVATEAETEVEEEEEEEEEARLFSKCVACKMARYCSKECQTKDWKTNHRRMCKILFPKITKLFDANMNDFEEYTTF